MSYRDPVGMLVSGDNQGKVCFWNIKDLNYYRSNHLFATPIILTATTLMESLTNVLLTNTNHTINIINPSTSNINTTTATVTTNSTIGTSSILQQTANTLGSRIHDLYLSESGQSVCVALYDRLLLIAVTYQVRDTTQNNNNNNNIAAVTSNNNTNATNHCTSS